MGAFSFDTTANFSETLEYSRKETLSGINGTSAFDIFKGIEWSVDFFLLLLSLLTGIVWLTYITYYNGRIFGVILTKLLNRFVSRGEFYLQFGSFTFSVLTGKIMFRDFVYADRNVTVRVADGFVQFRYWMPYKTPNASGRTGVDKNESSLSQRKKTASDCRLWTILNGFECHFYNWVSKYETIDKMFDLNLFPSKQAAEEIQPNTLNSSRWHWRRLVPAVGVNVTSGKITFGNKYVPSSLVLTFENAASTYSTSPASNIYDRFLHTFKGNCENVKAALVKSLDYAGIYEHPPRIMGEGFVVLQTSYLDFYHYQDELGLVPTTGVFDEDAAPLWGTNFSLGKGTVISYGPWADDQRALLYNFFFPVNFGCADRTQLPAANEKRIFTKYELKVNTFHDSTFDVLFIRDGDVPNAMHLNFVKGSWFELTLPWVVGEDGSTNLIQGQFLMIDSSTSLEYRPLFAGETLSFTGNLHYPRSWCEHQKWEFVFKGSKSTLNFVYAHKEFVQDLIREWSSREPSDFCRFVPYSYAFEFKFEDFAVNLTTNAHNWIDTSSQCEENCHVSITGASVSANFVLPFREFSPKSYELRFFISGENLNLKYYLPEQHTLKQSLRSLFESAKVELHGCGPQADIWIDASKGADGWFDCWRAPAGLVSINYTMQSMPIVHNSGIPPEEEKIEQLSSLDLSQMDADLINVELEVGPSIVFLTAFLVKSIFALKEDYFGECQTFTDVTTVNEQHPRPLFGLYDSATFDVRRYRPLHVKVALVLHEIQAHCLTYALAKDSHCPMLFCEQFIFEMDKQFSETKLQLALSPVLLHCVDSKKNQDGGLGDDGRLMLSAFQMRAHAMFSSSGLPFDAPTLEYAWMMEFTVGDLVGRIDAGQMLQIVRFLDTFFTHLLNDEENLPYPKALELCVHMQPRTTCPKKGGGELCDSEHELKYKFLRFNVDSVRLFLVDKNLALEIFARPLRAVNCTEHFFTGKEGLSLGFGQVQLRQFVKYTVSIATSTPTSSSSGDNWLECGLVELSKWNVDACLPWPKSEYEKRRQFLTYHDNSTRRLYFLWLDDEDFTCGCYGGCQFYGFNSQGKTFKREFASKAFSSLCGLATPSSFADDDASFGQSLLRNNETTLRNFTQSPPMSTSQFVSTSSSSRLVNLVKATYSVHSEMFFDAKEEFFNGGVKKSMDNVKREVESSESDGSSYVSMSSTTAPTPVDTPLNYNLYSQVNRPIFQSPLLMTSYSKNLNTYSCANWNLPSMCHSPSPNFWAPINLTPDFVLVNQGLNNLTLVDNEDIERNRAQRGFSNEDSNDLSSKWIKLNVDRGVRLFGSPLGVEFIGQFFAETAKQLIVEHPAYIVQKLFNHCSTSSHIQSLISPDNVPTTEESGMFLFDFRFGLVELSFFQCGVVEKIVPVDHIEQLLSLTPASIVVSALKNIQIEGAGRVDVNLTAEMDSAYVQLLQIVEKGASTIGISRNASKIPYETNWHVLPMSQQLSNCVVIEGALRTFSCKSSLRPNRKNVKDSSNSSTEALLTPESAENLESSEDNAKLNLCVGNVSAKFGLCQPLETTAESWLLYDLLAPSICAWLHVVHRADSTATTLFADTSLHRKKVILFLLTEALDWPKSIGTKKSRFDAVKVRRCKLTQCPSCQLALCLISYCADDKFREFETRWTLPDGVLETKALPIAMITLLSHWRDVLSAEHLIKLDNERAKMFVNVDDNGEARNTKKPNRMNKKSVAPAVEATCIDIEMEATDGEKACLLQKEPSNLEKGLKREGEVKKSKKTSSERGATMESQTNVRRSPKVAQSKRQDSGLSTSSSSATKAVGSLRNTGTSELKEDLYTWMAREQELERKKSKPIDGAARTAENHNEVNPIDLPLEIYFEVVYKCESLIKTKQRAFIFHVIGETFVVDATLSGVELILVEPKLLHLPSVTGLKRITHTERPLVLLEEFTGRAVAAYQRRNNAAGKKKTQQTIDYKMRLRSCTITAGFAPITFLNELAFVARSVRDTIEEFGTVDTEEAPLSEKRRGRAKSTETVRSHDGAGSARSMASSFQRTPSEMEVNWSRRLLTILKDYQRAKFTSVRKSGGNSTSPTMTPSSDFNADFEDACCAKTKISGAIECQMVELSAVFTEIFVNTSFTRVELDLTSVDCWSKVPGEYLDLSEVYQLIASEQSLKCSVQRVSSRLSETHARQQNFATISQMTVEQSQMSFDRQLMSTSDENIYRNTLKVEIGPIVIDIPLDPGFLHDVVMRGQRNLSERISMLTTPQVVEEVVHVKRKALSVGQYSRQLNKNAKVAEVHFDFETKALDITAALLPSLRASYRMSSAKSVGVTGREASFTVDVVKHWIIFDVKELAQAQAEAYGVSPKIEMDLPALHGRGAYVQHIQPVDGGVDAARNLFVKEGGYLRVEVEVGALRHTLTTDLLNQLLFIQEAFMRELMEIVAKIVSEKKPTTIGGGGGGSPSAFSHPWTTSVGGEHSKKSMLYLIEVVVQNIQITATTPTSTAVRLETEQVRVQFSNRFLQKTSKGDTYEKVFGVAEISVVVALGQLTKNALYEELEPEFQQFANFKTEIGVRNVTSNEDADHSSFIGVADVNLEDTRTYLINLHRPVMFIQPTAVDKAILLWLNYRNTYEFWNEQRKRMKPKTSNTRQPSVFDQLGSPPLAAAISSGGPLFLQVTINDGLYIGIPLMHNASAANLTSGLRGFDETSALLISLENTSIVVCSCGCLVSRGRFNGFCVRFIEDFDAPAESWQPHLTEKEFVDNNLNACYVPEGTYDMCSKTINAKDEQSSAEWILNIGWQMKGLDMKFNTRIGKLSSMLVATLTSLAGDDNVDSYCYHETSPRASPSPTTDGGTKEGTNSSDGGGSEAEDLLDDLPAIQRLPRGKNRTKMIEAQMHEQAKLVNNLITYGASEATIEVERRRLQRLEAALYSEFRREMVEKLRKQSQKATTSFRDRIGFTINNPAAAVEDVPLRHKRKVDLTLPLTVGRRHSEVSTAERANWRQQKARTKSIDVGKDLKFLSVDGEESPSPVPEEEDGEQDEEHSFSTLIVGEGEVPPVPETSVGGQLPGSPRVNQMPPSINLYLDVQIYVDSGECTFQTLPPAKVESGIGSDGYTPKVQSSRQRSAARSKLSNQLLTDRMRSSSAAPTTCTKIALPGLSVKTFYASHSGADASTLNPTLLRLSGLTEDVISHMISSNKKGQFYMCLSLGSMPAETVVSPHILDFLEQTLEPIPPTPAQSSKVGGSVDASTSAGAVPTANVESFNLDAASAAVSSFPVDVVVYINVQSSNIRFTSSPFSMVECLLRLPQLQLVATSRKSELLTDPRQVGSMSALKRNVSTQNMRISSAAVDDDLSGGISVTVMLTDFSLYVFHPYGTTNVGAKTSGNVDRRDALSVSIKEVVANISRSRNVLSMEVLTNEMASQEAANKMKNSVKFSLLIDVSTAQFKYDMRRLTEILSFPKAWYRRTIVRRLFFGDDTIIPSKVFSSSTPSMASTVHTSSTSRRNSVLPGTGVTVQGSPKKEHMDANPSSSEEELNKSERFQTRRKSQTETNRARWEALVLFGIKFNELTVEAMMGQAMGSTTFKINGATSQGHINVNSEGMKNVYLLCGMSAAVLEAKQGMVSGVISLNSFDAFALLRDAAGRTPEHQVGASLKSSDLRVDWMTSTIFIGKVTNFNVSFNDEWKTARGGADLHHGATRTSMAVGPVEQSFVRVSGAVHWDSMYVMITKTTVSDFIRIYNKLYEFFEQQMNSGRMFFVLEPASTTASRMAQRASDAGLSSQKSSTTVGAEPEPMVELRYHRHWQKALELVTGIQLAAADYFPLPTESTIVGGTLEVSCGELALSCFHGPNFTTPQWVIFYLNEVDVNFCVEAKDVVINGAVGAKVVQNLTLRLGKDQIRRSEQPMATVLRVSRSGPFYPPQSSTIDDWLSYTFTSVLSESFGLSVAATGWKLKSGKNIVNFLFKFPALRINQRTEHEQHAETPSAEDPAAPVVGCAFVADFDGYLLLSQEIDALVTLAELVRSYLAEKQPSMGKTTAGEGVVSKKAAVVPKMVTDPTEELQKDGRVYETLVWQVAPQINFITLSERGQMERFEKMLERGVEHIFNVMGFKDPSKTIPKWIQRGCMDPIDGLLAALLERLLVVSKKH